VILSALFLREIDISMQMRRHRTRAIAGMPRGQAAFQCNQENMTNI
jgi:hypothetical protein